MDLLQLLKTEKSDKDVLSQLSGGLCSFLRKCLFRVITVGPIPKHIAFILDGNRRYAKKHNLKPGGGHRVGFLSLMGIVKYCYELGVKYVTIFAFSIDNFNRRPDEIQYVMDLMQEKIEGLLKEENVLNQYGARILFVGELKLLYEPVRLAAEKAMKLTAKNDNTVLIINVAYTSSYEMVRSVKNSVKSSLEEKHGGIQDSNLNGAVNGVVTGDRGSKTHSIRLMDIEKNMFMAVAPDPDILVRTSGETRLSNYLLWQTTNCVLYSPEALWPEIGLRHLVWAILNFQRNYSYLEKRKEEVALPKLVD